MVYSSAPEGVSGGGGIIAPPRKSKKRKKFYCGPFSRPVPDFQLSNRDKDKTRGLGRSLPCPVAMGGWGG